ncbi:uncharacterized protein N0V89_005126 [Didymosphaeria variabile]|uniref:Uncharacterized protein n=1 Tax=Didymosphaeria variabile TaxID=1932322 RepID=A0A9W8XK82_9PLEO|nr:uncharacterized protein N0V89_005126 [Didymosphaeria variabile]KAJ4353397.1 hypothetical protein N0V89_005126 [Didymosphaeria variabile]
MDPFMPGKNFNTSAMVRDALPETIKLDDSRLINIIKYPHDIQASWSEVRETVPQILSNKRRVFMPDCEDPDAELRIDILVQLGMRRSEDCIVFETVAWRDGYVQLDVDDKTLPPGDVEHGGIWEGLPEKLATCFSISKLQRNRWIKRFRQVSTCSSRTLALIVCLQDIPIRVSQDANSFICEFQFYSALAELYKRHLPARVIFVHTPPGTAEKDIQDCAVIVEALIKTLVEQSGL